MMPASWIATGVFGCLWFGVASLNAYYRSEGFIRRNRREASSVPFIGAVFAILAIRACPWNSPLKWLLLIAAFLLDFGSLRYVILMLMAILFPEKLAAVNRKRAERVQRILAGSPFSGPPQARA